MSYPIEAKWKLSMDSWLQANRMHWRSKIPRWVRVAFIPVAVGMWVPLLSGLFIFGKSEPAAEVWCVVSVWMLIQFLVLMPRTWRKTFEKHPSRGTEVRWTFAPESVYVSSTAGKSELNWSAFVAAGVHKEGLLLFPQKNFSHWVPASAFASPEEFSRFVGLVKSKVAKTKEIR